MTEKDQKLTIENNTCIVSSSLLDELDYVIGGYGQPTVEFLFNFNAFIEAYILSSSFIMSKQESDHIQITRKVLFPNGRPIYELIENSKKLSIIEGLGNPLMLCVYVDKIDKPSAEVVHKAIEEFSKRDVERIKKSFVRSDLNRDLESYKAFSIGFGKGQILIGETTNEPLESVKKFFDSITNFNVQAALPLFTYKQQFQELSKKAISKEIYKTLCDIQGQNIKDAENYLGSELQAIPPLVSIVLSKSKVREDIPRVLNEIREDFTDYRECCEQFENRLNNAITIKEQIQAINDYKTFWATLVKKYTDKTSRIMFRFVDVVKESDYENALDKALDNQTAENIFGDLNIGKVAGKTGYVLWEKFKEKRILNKFKGVVNLWALVENSPTNERQIKDIERIFKTNINRKRVVVAKRFLSDIQRSLPKNTLPKAE